MAVLLFGISDTAILYFPFASFEWGDSEASFNGPGGSTLGISLSDVGLEVGPPTSKFDEPLSQSVVLHLIRARLRSRGVEALQIWTDSGCLLICERSELEAVRLPIQ